MAVFDLVLCLLSDREQRTATSRMGMGHRNFLGDVLPIVVRRADLVMHGNIDRRETHKRAQARAA
jgi:hypothetical protein